MENGQSMSKATHTQAHPHTTYIHTYIHTTHIHTAHIQIHTLYTLHIWIYHIPRQHIPITNKRTTYHSHMLNTMHILHTTSWYTHHTIHTHYSPYIDHNTHTIPYTILYTYMHTHTYTSQHFDASRQHINKIRKDMKNRIGQSHHLVLWPPFHSSGQTCVFLWDVSKNWLLPDHEKITSELEQEENFQVTNIRRQALVNLATTEGVLLLLIGSSGGGAQDLCILGKYPIAELHPRSQ